MDDRASDLPHLALSVRQPWAWAIVAGHKAVENRSAGAIRSGNMAPRRIAVHAAQGMKRDEYDWAVWRLHRHGLRAPRPETLVRRAVIGAVTVTDIVSESDSEWFGGPMGLLLNDAVEVQPIPAPGALGYFRWERNGALAAPLPWMETWDRPGGDVMTGDLFDDLAPGFRTPPERPRRRK